SINSKAFRVFNGRTRIFKENLDVQFSENIPNITRSGPNWLFDIDALTKSINYKSIVAGNQSNGNVGIKACDDAGKMKTVSGKDYILLPLWPTDLLFSQSSKSSFDAEFNPSEDDEKKVIKEPGKEGGDSSKEDEINDQEKDDNVNSTNKVNVVGKKSSIELPDDPNMPELEDIVYSDIGTKADMNNLDAFMPVSPIQTTRIHKDHPVEQIIRDLNPAPQTRRMTKNLEEHGLWMSRVLFFMVRLKRKSMFINHQDFKDPDFPDRVYKVEKTLYELHHAPRAWYETLSTYLLDNGFQRGKIDKTLFIRRDTGDILLVQVYVDDIVFGSTKKSLCTEFEKIMHKKFQMSSMGELIFFLGLQIASTPMETQKPLLKDEDGEEVDVHLYRSMIGSLMYLTFSRPDIMFAVCACARYQVNPKVSHLHAVKRIFKYLKGQPKLGLWYPKDSPFDLVAYTDSDYAGVSLDRKFTMGGCQFCRCRLISWQCKKRIVVHNSTIKAEYVAASSCCGQVLWIQNQLLDYGYNFMHTKIYIDNESTICIVKNPVFYSKTKHIEIRHHFIRDSNEKKLIQMIKIHTDKNIADLFTKAFDVKIVNGEQQLQALVDGKKIVVTEASVRRDLQLDDEEGTYCLPNATIFEELTRMGAKTTAWNEFSSTMASAIICLATNQKFNFSKYIFESMVKNLDNAGKFLMYPRFIKVFLDNQLEEMSSHNRIYVTPSHTKKIFAKMRRQGKDFFGRETSLFPTMVVQAQEEMGEGSANLTNPHYTPIITQPSSSQPQRKQKSRRSKRKDTEVLQPSDPINVADEAVNEEPKKKLGSRTYKLKRLYKVGRSTRIVSSDEASLGDQKDASKQGRKIDDIDKDVEVTLIDETQGRHDDDIMFDVSDLAGEEVFVAEQGVPDSKKDDVVQVNTAATTVSTASTIPVSAATITKDDITLAQALAELKSVKPKVTTAITATTILQEPSESITTTTTSIPSKDKGKGIMVEEPLKIKKKDQISFDEQEAIRLQAKFDKEERLAREKDEANVALIKEWNDIQAKIDADYQMAKQMQAEEQEELSIKEKSKLFVQLLEASKKHFVVKGAEEKRNRPPKRAQQRSIMCTYLKNMAGWKPKDLQNKSFASRTI
ncbi:putative ribonuclease H-like domain-containing protein, partial [Tanacetum coccineum]